jgi:sialate O-acetylesterase
MLTIHDYQILKRDVDGFADAPLCGKIPEGIPSVAVAYYAVFLEENNQMILPWTRCEQTGAEWHATLRLPQGGLYRVEVRAAEDPDSLEWSPIIGLVHHVGVGELYLLAGQSNMAGYGRDFAYDPPEPGVHMYGNDGQWKLAVHPLNVSLDTIYPENKELTCGTSPALSFARAVKRWLKVPIGLIPAALGGSPLSMWQPLEDGRLYRGMMRRLLQTGAVSGVLWYQGCSDANEKDADGYLERFVSMVSLWRSELGDIPIVTVQLNRRAGAAGDTAHRAWAAVREAQRLAAQRLSRLYIVPANDLPMSDFIHNSSGANVILGERMALALKAGESTPSVTLFPDAEYAELLSDTRVHIGVRNGVPMRVMDETGSDFTFEDEGGLISCVAAGADKDGVTLTPKRPIILPAYVHGGWRCDRFASMPRALNGCPMLSFYKLPVQHGGCGRNTHNE